jgi:hypothetical protein
MQMETDINTMDNVMFINVNVKLYKPIDSIVVNFTLKPTEDETRGNTETP